MASMDEIGQEKQWISERLAQLDAERTRLCDQLNELEISERVLTRFGERADTTEGRRSGRPAKTAPVAGGERRARGVQKAPRLCQVYVLDTRMDCIPGRDSRGMQPSVPARFRATVV